MKHLVHGGVIKFESSLPLRHTEQVTHHFVILWIDRTNLTHTHVVIYLHRNVEWSLTGTPFLRGVDVPGSNMIQTTLIPEIGVFYRIPVVDMLTHLVLAAGNVELAITVKQQESIHGVGTFYPTHV